MRLGLVADIHGNYEALVRALEEMESEVDEVLCAGDAVFQYSFSNQVFDLIQRRHIRAVLGNHEAVILAPGAERLRNSGAILPQNLRFVQALPEILETRVNGKKLLMVHGSPWNPLKEYVFPSSNRIDQMPEVGADIIIMGHTHVPMVKRVGKVLVINPGSCGLSRNESQLTYAIVDTESDEAWIRTVGAPPPPPLLSPDM